MLNKEKSDGEWNNWGFPKAYPVTSKVGEKYNTYKFTIEPYKGGWRWVNHNCGSEFYYKDKTLECKHRLDGPAIVHRNSAGSGEYNYFIDNKMLSQQEFISLTKTLKDFKDIETIIDLTKI